MSVLDLFRLDGKLALVTGCRRGIGRAMAEALAEAGADIVGVSAYLGPGSEVGEAIQASGRAFHPFQCDLADRAAVYRLVAEVRERFPAIDILVNNAGTILRKPAAEHPDEYWDRVVDVNLNSPWILAREFGRGMLARGRGKVLFTASLLTFQGGVTVPSYAASKGGLGSLVKALSNEWAGHGVQVNAIAPGYVATDNTEALRNDPVRNSAILARIPAGRWGEPADLKGAAVFLASDASNYVTGEILTVDGGWMGR